MSVRPGQRDPGFTLVELLVCITVILVVTAVTVASSQHAYRAASLASSANNLRQLATGAAAYLADNNYTYWPFRRNVTGEGVRWWYGFETQKSLSSGEGNRWFDPSDGLLGGYVPSGMAPDPSFALAGKPFKPKYQWGYIGVAYNILLADSSPGATGRWTGAGRPAHHLSIGKPAETVVFATSGQINTFQKPASRGNPMVEEFYGIDQLETTVHFRHNGKAMVAFANGSAGWLEMDPSTLDPRDPDAMIGRFAPRGSSKHLR